MYVCVSRKRPRLDGIGMQFQAFMRNFFKIPYNDNAFEILFLIQSNKPAAVCRQSLVLWSSIPNIFIYLHPYCALNHS